MRFLIAYIILFTGCTLTDNTYSESNKFSIELGFEKSIKVVDGKDKYLIDDTTLIRTNIKFNISKVIKINLIDNLAETEQCMNQKKWRKRKIITVNFDPNVNIRSTGFDMKLPCVRFINNNFIREKELDLTAEIITVDNKIYYATYKMIVIIQNPIFF